MINKLKRKFLMIGTVFMFILMSLLVFIMNIVNFCEVTADADLVLDVLTQENLPFLEDKQAREKQGKTTDFVPRGMSP